MIKLILVAALVFCMGGADAEEHIDPELDLDLDFSPDEAAPIDNPSPIALDALAQLGLGNAPLPLHPELALHGLNSFPLAAPAPALIGGYPIAASYNAPAIIHQAPLAYAPYAAPIAAPIAAPLAAPLYAGGCGCGPSRHQLKKACKCARKQARRMRRLQCRGARCAAAAAYGYGY